MTYRVLVPALVLLFVAGGGVWAQELLVEDWSKYPLGMRGVPPGWEKQKWGNPKYEFAIVETDGRRALHLKSIDDGSTISKEIKGNVNLKQTPVLEWSWKVLALPVGGDSRKAATDDQAAQVFVAWPRFPEMVRSQIIGYVWDTTAPVGTIVKSEKTSTVTYVVLRSGTTDIGKWVTERRNVREDFRKIYGGDPDNPAAVSIAIDSNDTHSSAESFVGAIFFKKQ